MRTKEDGSGGIQFNDVDGDAVSDYALNYMVTRTALINRVLCLPDWYGKRDEKIQSHEHWERVVSYDPAAVFDRLPNLNPYKRVQSGMSMLTMWPTVVGMCACGCGKMSAKHQSFGSPTRYHNIHCSAFCNQVFSIIYGDTKTIGRYLRMIHGDQCVGCGVTDGNL